MNARVPSDSVEGKKSWTACGRLGTAGLIFKSDKAGECVDIDECATGENYCQSFETCQNTNGNFKCNFDYSNNCPDSKYAVEWKGAKFTRTIFQSKSSLVALVNINKAGGFDLRRNQYIGFLAYPRNLDEKINVKCFRNFINFIICFII